MHLKTWIRVLSLNLLGGFLLCAGCDNAPFILFDDDGDFDFVAPKDTGSDALESDTDFKDTDGLKDGPADEAASDIGLENDDAPAPECAPDDSSWNNPERVVAIGDFHGYLPGALRILALTELIDQDEHWTGGRTVLVQVGDTIDKGDFDREVMDLLERLKVEARKAGGNVYILIGTHETENAMLDFGSTDDDSFAAFDDLPYDSEDPVLAELPEEQRARAAAFRPGGIYAKILARHKIAVILGGTLFVHAGLAPEYAELGIAELNEGARDWLLGDIPIPDFLEDDDGPVRTRLYGYRDEEEVDCEEVHAVLDSLCVDRMVIGHTIQKKINSICDGRLYRIDVGMVEETHVGAIEIMGHDIRFIEDEKEESEEWPLD